MKNKIKASPFSARIDKDTCLCLLGPDDAGELLALVLANKKHLGPWFPWVKETKEIANSERFIERCLSRFNEKRGCDLGIFHQGKLVGMCGFHTINMDNKFGIIGYWISKDHEGRGIITAAVKKLIAVGKKEYRMHRIEIEVDIANDRSKVIPKRLGFTREGIRREAAFYNKSFHSLEVYSLLPWTEGNK